MRLPSFMYLALVLAASGCGDTVEPASSEAMALHFDLAEFLAADWFSVAGTPCLAE